MPLSGGDKEKIKVVILPDKDPREVKVWSNMSEDGTNFARTSTCESEKLSDGIEDNRENDNLDSACKSSTSTEKEEDFGTGLITNLAQALALIVSNEKDITIQVVSKGDDDVVDNVAMPKIDHELFDDRREEITNAVTTSNTAAQDVIDQTDGKTEKISNAMIGSQEQDIDISTVFATYGGEPVSKSKSKRKKKIGTCTEPISNRNHKTYRRNTDNNTAAISSTNFQPNVALIYYSKNPPKISKADILKSIIKKEQSKVSRVFNTEIDVALTDEDEKSVSVNVGVVSKTKPQRVVPLIYNTEKDINVQKTSDDHDGKESDSTRTSNTDFEGVWVEDEGGMDVSIDSIDYPDSRELTPLINNNENVVCNKDLSGTDIINWYNYAAMVRQLFKHLADLKTRKSTGTSCQIENHFSKLYSVSKFLVNLPLTLLNMITKFLTTSYGKTRSN